MDLAGASALVTGAASGLGRAAALELQRRGAHVIGLDRRAVPAAQDLRVVAGDVTSEVDVQKALSLAEDHAPLRAAVCCAGIGTAHRTIGFPLAVFTRVVMVNLVGTFNVLRLAAERMASTEVVDGERGVLVATASIAAFDGQVGQVAYSASKAGIAGLTLPMARDLARERIRVVTVAPGMFDTPMFSSLPPETIESLAGQVPHPSRLGRPEEFAALVGHVIDNPMINGDTIRLDGALRMGPR